MKLLFCGNCEDVIRLLLIERSCRCGSTRGRYLDEVNAIYSGRLAFPIGFNNTDLLQAVVHQPANGQGREFTAFVIPRECLTFKKEDGT